MKKRIITAVILLAIIVPVVVMPNTNKFFFIVFQIMMGALVIAGAVEMLQMYDKKKKLSTPFKVSVIALAFITYLNFGSYWNFTSPNHFPILDLKLNQIALLVFSVVIMLTVFVFDKDTTGEDIGKAIFIMFYVGLGSASIAVLKMLGVRFIVYVILISTCTDMFAYFVGISFGKHKMAPNISPKKSWEGAIGGTIIATVIASCFAIFYGDIFTQSGFLGHFFNPDGMLDTIFDSFSSLNDDKYYILRPVIIVFITFLGSVGAQIGDLVASKLKRHYEIKDFGKIFPGHGGVMDRFDSILFISLLFVGIFLMIQQVFPILV